MINQVLAQLAGHTRGLGEMKTILYIILPFYLYLKKGINKMPQIIELKTFTDKRGNLTVIEDREIPFAIKRVFYIYGVDESVRGGHCHKTTHQALFCLKGSCKIYNNNSKTKEEFVLDKPNKCLILFPEDWHKMYDFTSDCILQVFASTHFDKNDYIFEEYQ